MTWQKAVYLLLFVICISPFGSPPLALACGLGLALVVGNPFPKFSGKPVKYLLQASVVLLGFGMDLQAIVRAGRDGIIFTIITIAGTLLLGYGVGRALNVRSKTSALISSGTAICGGSAIAAVGPSIGADPDEMSVSLGTVFLLNAVALFLFPVIGSSLGLTQAQFGIWAAIAIHDTSSVVGAAGTYGAEALSVATTVKLARALWIAPLALVFAYLYRKDRETRAKVNIPWFIALFIIAATVRTYGSSIIFPSVYDALVNLGKTGMIITLFLIGAGLSRKMLANVGIRPLMQGLILWIVISIATLWAVVNLL